MRLAMVAGLVAALGACSDSVGGSYSDRARALIRGDRFARLVLEVDTVPGRELRAGVASELAAGFVDLLDKPDGIEAIDDGVLAAAGDDHTWSIDELDQLADDTFDLAASADTIKLHLLLVDGRYGDDGETILGVAWANTNAALFVDTIEAACGSILPPLVREEGCAAAQLAIATHEIGHTIGLVGAGVPPVSDHQDETHGAHDVSDACVMYWAYEGDALLDWIGTDLLGGGDGSLGFDAACRADVAAIRD